MYSTYYSMFSNRIQLKQIKRIQFCLQLPLWRQTPPSLLRHYSGIPLEIPTAVLCACVFMTALLYVCLFVQKPQPLATLHDVVASVFRPRCGCHYCCSTLERLLFRRTNMNKFSRKRRKRTDRHRRPNQMSKTFLLD